MRLSGVYTMSYRCILQARKVFVSLLAVFCICLFSSCSSPGKGGTVKQKAVKNAGKTAAVGVATKKVSSGVKDNAKDSIKKKD